MHSIWGLSETQTFGKYLKRIAVCPEKRDLGEKEKMPVTNIFSFFHNVFNKLFYLGCSNCLRTVLHRIKKGPQFTLVTYPGLNRLIKKESKVCLK